MTTKNRVCPVCGKPYADYGINADGTHRFVHFSKKIVRGAPKLVYCHEEKTDDTKDA